MIKLTNIAEQVKKKIQLSDKEKLNYKFIRNEATIDDYYKDANIFVITIVGGNAYSYTIEYALNIKFNKEAVILNPVKSLSFIKNIIPKLKKIKEVKFSYQKWVGTAIIYDSEKYIIIHIDALLQGEKPFSFKEIRLQPK